MRLSAEEIREFVRNKTDKKRYKHSVATANEALSLARRYGADEDKAYIAGLLHDIAKGLEADDLINIVNQSGLEVDEYELKNPELMHGKAGAAIACKELGICDEEILSAIRWHTTGRENMPLLEKIIYIADIIEPGRDFDETDTLRRAAYYDIDSAMLQGLEHVMRFVKIKGFSLHPKSMEAYEYIKKNGGK